MIEAPATTATEDGRKLRAARLSIVSNSSLIVLKLVAGAATGSIAIITEAVHSSIDLLASFVAYFSIRKADEPADDSHMYGHEKVENLASALEGILILVGAGIIIFESARRLSHPRDIESLGFGIAAIAISMVVNFAVSTYLSHQARATDSPALEGDAAHLWTDALTSGGVLVALALVAITGEQALDPITALVVATVIVWSGIRIVNRSSRVLVDEALPEDELAQVGEAIAERGPREVVGFHKLRARRAGSRRHIDLHVQFASGTTLERAHHLSHQLQREIERRIPHADVLIHLEPEDPAAGAEPPGPSPPSAG
ncbi:MAG TPA: cation diffusion facilitator family transporter [Thermoleophilaceae bacterium]|nr:cation diffusion facilitator family transporter [Thermoleophilaceae bacterium]